MTDTRRLKPLDPSVSPRFGDVATLLRAPRAGLGATTTFVHIVLPQALRNM